MIDQWIKDLWDRNKLLFILLSIPILLVIFRNFLIDLLVRNAKEKVEDAKKKDEVLSKEADDANKKADDFFNFFFLKRFK